MPRHRLARTVCAGVLLAATAATAACSGSPEELDTAGAAPTPTTTTSPSPTPSPTMTTTTTAPVKRGLPEGWRGDRYAIVRVKGFEDVKATDAVVRFATARVGLVNRRAKDLAPLRRATTGEYRDYITGLVARNVKERVVFDLPQKYVVVGASRGASTANLRVCIKGGQQGTRGKAKKWYGVKKPWDKVVVRARKTDKRWIVYSVEYDTFSCAGAGS